jgi:hypothetical protein
MNMRVFLDVSPCSLFGIDVSKVPTVSIIRAMNNRITFGRASQVAADDVFFYENESFLGCISV